jgi:quinol monooxygenase YgiN
MIHVIATIEIAEGKRDAFLAEFHKVVPPVLAEKGCIDYGPTIDVATGIPAQGPLRDDVVTVVERWESLEALRAHLQAPHMAEYRARVKDLVRGVKLQVVQPT